CEQYASAMALLARAAGLPSRVAIGYTAGFQAGDYRSITSQDAHAWVEIFFPGQGWTMFDPTPLTDGRTYTPPYASPTGNGADASNDPKAAATTPSGDPSATAPNSKDNTADPNPGTAASGTQQEAAPAWVGWTTGAIALFALLLSILIMGG